MQVKVDFSCLNGFKESTLVEMLENSAMKSSKSMITLYRHSVPNKEELPK